MTVDESELDFGLCTICETVRRTVHLTNKGMLPLRYGCLGLPEYVSVQPNDGFGCLLPLATAELDVLFSAPKAGDFQFNLVIKNLFSKAVQIKCKGVGVSLKKEFFIERKNLLQIHHIFSHHLSSLPAYDFSSLSIAFCGPMLFSSLFML